MYLQNYFSKGKYFITISQFFEILNGKVKHNTGTLIKF